jgi:hypothetical protein
MDSSSSIQTLKAEIAYAHERASIAIKKADHAEEQLTLVKGRLETGQILQCLIFILSVGIFILHLLMNRRDEDGELEISWGMILSRALWTAGALLGGYQLLERVKGGEHENWKVGGRVVEG